MLYTVEHQREISCVAGPYSVTLFRHQGDREDRARAVILYCITGIGTPEACDEKATEFEKNFSGVNLGRLLVAGDGLKYEAMTIPAEAAQLIEQLQWTVIGIPAQPSRHPTCISSVTHRAL